MRRPRFRDKRQPAACSSQLRCAASPMPTAPGWAGLCSPRHQPLQGRLDTGSGRLGGAMELTAPAACDPGPPTNTPVLTSALSHLAPRLECPPRALHLGSRPLLPVMPVHLCSCHSPAQGPWTAGAMSPTPKSTAPPIQAGTPGMMHANGRVSAPPLTPEPPPSFLGHPLHTPSSWSAGGALQSVCLTHLWLWPV